MRNALQRPVELRDPRHEALRIRSYAQAGLPLETFKRLRELATLIEATDRAGRLRGWNEASPGPAPELKSRPRI